ncbi:RHS repeat-associated core domain-containing protein [Ottowia testudinis]|uniref:RHS repeat-associated core domain-containing protein n=1 Tax=Ottowia testudinis TaxID=2816950 RepID=A0A975H4V7_9BURK|nr:RHS repeat-associated core domain-containing protein [Ottowia testudinis]
MELNLRFPGQYYDQETNLHQNYFRDYSPARGRYLQSDPIGLDGGWNIYAYSQSHPILLTDSKGLATIVIPVP